MSGAAYMLWVSRLKNGTSRQQKAIGNSRQPLYLKIIFQLKFEYLQMKMLIDPSEHYCANFSECLFILKEVLYSPFMLQVPMV